MMRIAVTWGLILGSCLLLWTAVVHLLGIYTVHVEYAAMFDTVVTVIPVAALTLALLERRRAQAGALAFYDGVMTGLVVVAVSAPITLAGMWFYHHYVNPDWLTILVDYERRKLTAAGVSSDKVAESLVQLQLSGDDRRQLIGGFIGTMAMGLVLSIIITAMLKFIPRLRRQDLKTRTRSTG
jgi:hypothetical protein